MTNVRQGSGTCSSERCDEDLAVNFGNGTDGVNNGNRGKSDENAMPTADAITAEAWRRKL